MRAMKLATHIQCAAVYIIIAVSRTLGYGDEAQSQSGGTKSIFFAVFSHDLFEYCTEKPTVELTGPFRGVFSR